MQRPKNTVVGILIPVLVVSETFQLPSPAPKQGSCLPFKKLYPWWVSRGKTGINASLCRSLCSLGISWFKDVFIQIQHVIMASPATHTWKHARTHARAHTEEAKGKRKRRRRGREHKLRRTTNLATTFPSSWSFMIWMNNKTVEHIFFLTQSGSKRL